MNERIFQQVSLAPNANIESSRLLLKNLAGEHIEKLSLRRMQSLLKDLRPIERVLLEAVFPEDQPTLRFRRHGQDREYPKNFTEKLILAFRLKTILGGMINSMPSARVAAITLDP